MLRCALCLLALVSIAMHTAAARTWYVKADGTGEVPTIQAGIDSCQHGDTVLVAAGTYSPSTQGGNAYGMLSILRGSADMTIVSESGPQSTVLDGQFQNRILFFQGETELTVDGFTFKRGEAPITGNFDGGALAAHLSSPVIKNCNFLSNSAADQGGAYWFGGVGSPQVIDCTFVGNSATSGGAMFLVNNSGNSVIRGCRFTGNTSTTNGGAIRTYNYRLTIEDCQFNLNEAAQEGGAIGIFNSHPISITSSTFSGNTAPDGSGVAVSGGSPVTIDQSIIAFGLGGSGVLLTGSTMTLGCTDMYGNEGGDWVGSVAPQLGTNGNFSADPLFCLGAAGNFYLRSDSPCAPGNHPTGDACGIIGLREVGCSTVPVEHRTWGQIKEMYGD